MAKKNIQKLFTITIAACFICRVYGQNMLPDIVVPGSIPRVFTQEGVSTPNDQSAPTFTPDGNTVYLADNNTIRVSRKVDGKWTRPKDLSFSGKWKDWDPFLSPEGKRLFFVSNRPLEGAAQDQPHKSNHLWYTDYLSEDVWSTPRRLDSPVNIEGINDYAPSVSRLGTLCFCSRNREGDKKMGAYYTKWLGDHYDKPRLLVLNGDNEVFDPFISPDERYIIFASNRNLYISFRQGDNWSPGQKLSAQINNGHWNGGPYVSPDGKMLYYAQEKAPGILMIPVDIPGDPAVLQPSIIDTDARAMVFAPGLISTPFIEAAASFKPDGNTVYFAQGTIYMTVCFSERAGGEWTKPKVASFSGRWSDWDPFLSPDGKRLFFVSSRPLEGVPPDKLTKKSHLWYVDQVSEDQWSAPHLLDAPFNLDSANNYAPTVSRAGTLFFCSNDRDGHPGMSSYCAKWLGDHYDKPKLLALNGKEETMDPFIAPDESYIIFASGNDLYISFRQGEDWLAGQNLGPQVNNGDSNFDPTVSPDGKTLYYASARIKGFYKRVQQEPALDYDGLLKEMQNIFNRNSNILMIPINVAIPL